MKKSVSDAFDLLDHPDKITRLGALSELCLYHDRDELPNSRKWNEPHLPSYEHIHSIYSYCDAVPGIYSVTHMIWSAFINGAASLAMIEHESFLHIDEAKEGVRIINQYRDTPVKLVLGVEFKTRIDSEALPGPIGELFRGLMKEAWGQDEAAWVVAMGVQDADEKLRAAVMHFQELKRQRAREQLVCLNEYYKLSPQITLEEILTPEGNLTDRQLSAAVATRKLGGGDLIQMNQLASAVRKLLNPGGPAHVPFPKAFPPYPAFVTALKQQGYAPFFTSQLKGKSLEAMIPSLISWGMAGIDIAGIEPGERDAAENIALMIEIARRNNLLLLGGSDYRGTGTGWQTDELWMRLPEVLKTIDQLKVGEIPSSKR